MADELPRREPLSKTPSWVMLGFILGGLTVYSLERHFTPRPVNARAPVAIQPVRPSPPRPQPPAELPRAALARFEDVFEAHRHHAIWQDDTTQVAIYNPETGGHTDFVEVRREDDTYFFRSLAQLTRPLVDRGMDARAPIRFTGAPVGDSTSKAGPLQRPWGDLNPPSAGEPLSDPRGPGLSLPPPTLPKPEAPDLR